MLPREIEAELQAVEHELDARPGMKAGLTRLRALRHAIESALAQAPAAPPTWQPIETAPKSVGDLLLAWPSGYVTAGYWDNPRNAWVTPHGRYGGSNAPTLWMPLPAALRPASAGQEE